MGNYKSTLLWSNSFGRPLDAANDTALALLHSSYEIFRDRAAALAAQIAKDLPDLTIHDVSHLDALWEIADLIAGPQYPMTPAEAFVFGGAVLLHDSALCFEAYEGGRSGLRATIQWRDAFAAIQSRMERGEAKDPHAAADFDALRMLHAARAAELATKKWITPDGDEIFLIENLGLRKDFGRIIGEIAASHHWPIEDLLSKLPAQINAPAYLPREWRVDPIKLACLLRCADAAHLDSRRAPDFLRALAKRSGISAQHWTTQNWLERADLDTSDPTGESIVFTSGKSFDERHADEWWVGYDAISIVDRELSACADMLEIRPQSQISPPFRVRRVTGGASPAVASNYITVTGWVPQAIKIQVSNVEKLISELGGSKLYGETQKLIVVLRELIQNARDSVNARRSIEPEFVGKIRVKMQKIGEKFLIIVEDDGVGMSSRVATGPLLDFGTSFWASDLVRSEFPGLLASGHRPIGKFGIGFYSVFMVAASVQLSTRRFDSGLESVTQVYFPRGLSLRPLISFGPPTGFTASTSTVVALTISEELGDPSSIQITPGREGYEPEVRLSFRQCLSLLCAGLDAVVELKLWDGAPVVVHRPLRELITQEARQEWLSQIIGDVGSTELGISIREHGARLRPITDGSNVHGMAALSTVRSPQNRAFGSIMTVGGLGFVISSSDLARFVGTIDYQPASAKREPSSQISAGIDSLRAWSVEQLSLLPPQSQNPLAWCYACSSLADLGLDPISAFCMVVNKQNAMSAVGLDALIDIMVTEGVAVYQTSIMDHMDNNHKNEPFESFPTIVPVCNSALLSLARDRNGIAQLTSFLSCVDRRLQERNLQLREEIRRNVAASMFGPMHVRILRASRKGS